jgi:streptogramin lyase
VTATDSPLPTVAANETGTIAAAADGHVWFTEHSAQEVGWITPSGQISEFATQ